MAETKSIILDKIVRDGCYLKICRNIAKGSNLYEDLFQETIIILLEKSEEKIIELHQNGELQAYFIGVAKNNFNSKTSPFFKKYKSKIEFLKEEGEDTTTDYYYEKIINYIKSGVFPRSEMFDSQVIRVLMIDKNIRKLSRKTGIDHRQIYAAIKRFKKRINDNEEFKRRSV